MVPANFNTEKTPFQTNMFVLLVCKFCSGTGLHWRERVRYDVLGDLLEVWIGEPVACKHCALSD